MATRIFLTIFTTVFLAELGDKTQLASMLFAAKDGYSRLMVFLAASSALVIATGIAVLVGEFVARYIPGRSLSIAAGVGFIGIGIWTLWKG